MTQAMNSFTWPFFPGKCKYRELDRQYYCTFLQPARQAIAPLQYRATPFIRAWIDCRQQGRQGQHDTAGNQALIEESSDLLLLRVSRYGYIQ
jgi:hypothetical protein